MPPLYCHATAKPEQRQIDRRKKNRRYFLVSKSRAVPYNPIHDLVPSETKGANMSFKWDRVPVWSCETIDQPGATAAKLSFLARPGRTSIHLYQTIAR